MRRLFARLLLGFDPVELIERIETVSVTLGHVMSKSDEADARGRDFLDECRQTLTDIPAQAEQKARETYDALIRAEEIYQRLYVIKRIRDVHAEAEKLVKSRLPEDATDDQRTAYEYRLRQAKDDMVVELIALGRQPEAEKLIRELFGNKTLFGGK